MVVYRSMGQKDLWLFMSWLSIIRKILGMSPTQDSKVRRYAGGEVSVYKKLFQGALPVEVQSRGMVEG